MKSHVRSYPQESLWIQRRIQKFYTDSVPMAKKPASEGHSIWYLLDLDTKEIVSEFEDSVLAGKMAEECSRKDHHMYVVSRGTKFYIAATEDDKSVVPGR